MKKKILTIICTIMIFIPWTILPLRTFQWALESPAAERIISGYAVFMIFSGFFTGVSYFGAKADGNLMKFCLLMNGLYAVGGAAALGMMYLIA